MLSFITSIQPTDRLKTLPLFTDLGS